MSKVKKQSPWNNTFIYHNIFAAFNNTFKSLCWFINYILSYMCSSDSPVSLNKIFRLVTWYVLPNIISFRALIYTCHQMYPLFFVWIPGMLLPSTYGCAVLFYFHSYIKNKDYFYTFPNTSSYFGYSSNLVLVSFIDLHSLE